MLDFIINGNKQLAGEVYIQGSKNAALPVIAAAVLKKGISRIKRCPDISDVSEMLMLIERLGCKVKREKDIIEIDARDACNVNNLGNDTGKTRAEILLLGAMLGRFGEAELLQPGGCSIGKRPIDYHIEAISAMNVQVECFMHFDKKVISCKSSKIKGAEIQLEFPSVGTTENVILTATLAEGTTHISNAAREPEITALCDFLRQSGADIKGDGSSDIYISGVATLEDCEYKLPEDRIVAGTYIIAAAAAGKDVTVRDIDACNIEALLNILKMTGCSIRNYGDSLNIKRIGRPRAFGSLQTGPYPGFPTDIQSQMMVLASICDGESVIIENIFEDRFLIASELEKMKAKISIDGRIARITGQESLYGTEVTACELRGGAALTIAGIAARGRTIIHAADYIYRGYEDICRDMTLLGADIVLKYGG